MSDDSDSNSSIDINVRSQGYWIAQTVGTCTRCGAFTRLLALGLPPRHEALSLDDGSDAAEPEAWELANCNAFLFYIERLPEAVAARLQTHSAVYRPAYSAAALGTYWANHCESCGSLLEDHDLFCEPDGAFAPASPAAAAAIELVRIEEPIAAAAAGYAIEPAFFESMRVS